MDKQNENPQPMPPPEENESGAKANDANQEEVKPMIEPHAPHHPVTGWRDIFIHIGVVTVGLLIAIGLEQTVEYFHHRHQVAEIREALAIERKINVVRFQTETEEMRRFVPQLKMNLAIYQYLRQHPGAPKEKWPGAFHLYSHNTNYTDAVWKTAQGSNVLQYMPQTEVRKLTGFYNALKNLNDLNSTKYDEKRESFRFFIQNPDATKFTTEQLDRAIDLTTETILLYAKEANLMSNYFRFDADFTGGPTTEDYNAILQFAPTPEDKKAVLEESARMAEREKEITISGIDGTDEVGR
jgi:hypothetical protein